MDLESEGYNTEKPASWVSFFVITVQNPIPEFMDNIEN